MLNQIKQFFSPIYFPEDEEKNRLSQIFYSLWIVNWGVLGFHLVGILFIYANPVATIIVIFLPILSFLLISRYFQKRGEIQTASKIFIYGIWFIYLTLTVLMGTLKSTIIAVPIAISATAVLLLGTQSGILLAILTILITLGMVIAIQLGNPPPAIFPAPEPALWFSIIYAFIYMLTPINEAIKNLKAAVSNVNQNEQRYRNLIEYAPSMYILIREEEGVQLIDNCNSAFLHTLGYAKPEVLDQPLAKFYAVESQQILNDESNFQKGLDHKFIEAEERYLLTKDGQTIPTIVQFAPEIAIGDSPPKVLGNYINMAGWKKTEQDLRESEGRYRTLFDNLPVPAFTKDIHGVYTSSNAENMKYVPENPIGKTDAQIFTPEIAKELRQTDLAVIESNKILITEEYLTHPRHGKRYFTSYKVPTHDDDGTITGILGVSREITEQKHIEDTLYFLAQKGWVDQKENFFTALAKHLGESLEVDYVFVNAVYDDKIKADTLGNYWLGEIQDNFEYTLKDTPCESVYGQELCTYPEKIQQNFPKDLNLVKMGAECYCGIPLLNSRGDPIGLIAILNRDEFNNVSLTEALLQIVASTAGKEIERLQADKEISKLNVELEKRVEHRTTELKVANEQLESFSYSISHDLRAPLRAIAGYASIIENDYANQLDEEALGYLRRISESSKTMNQLIQDLLAFSQLNQQQIRTQKVDPGTLVSEILAQFESNHTQIIVADDLPPCEADPMLLKQVFSNLLENSIKYSSSRENPKITVDWYLENEETIYSVKDNGVGFDMQYVDKIFQVFQRLHTASEFEGTGVGLAIVQRIIQQHRGRIWVESEVDQGATFYFSLPKI